ncbi:MAG: glycoside hydrolase family 65 [Phycisphaerae bacterium]|nr:glycoside hydrolase family 65 [Phycisphaerae bacterium]
MVVASPIDRLALVTRHNPRVHDANALSPLSVGNGELAFTVDVTGLQSFPEFYLSGIPLSTQSQWGWHSFPNAQAYTLADTFEEFDTYGRPVPYATRRNSDAGKALRASPHRLGLGHVGLEITLKDGSLAAIQDIEHIDQTLDLWQGVIVSRFTVEDEPVEVRTVCHPSLDLVGITIDSDLVAQARLAVTFRFAYGSDQFGKAPEDWTRPDQHQTTLIHQSGQQTDLLRTLDQDQYYVSIQHASDARVTRADRHVYTLTPAANSRVLSFCTGFSNTPIAPMTVTAAQTLALSSAHWQDFWSTGGAIDLSGSKDERAAELERRIVLSQYVLAIQCAGSRPPQETGLTFNSWHGKFHLEMHWWHAVNFALWDRIALLEKSLPWYSDILPAAQAATRVQGYDGVRWPKMVGPDGRDSPSDVGTLLIWQQPHPIYYAELCYRAHPDVQTLERYKELVFQTAEFMVSYAHWKESEQRYVLGPPVIPAQECHPAGETMNPTFELEYWDWALKVAQQWRQRLGLRRHAGWDHVIEHLSDLPVKDGVYLMEENRWITRDHPSLLGAMGILPGARADKETMRRTLRRVMTDWDWESTWGWDFPMIAMTAARLGEPDIAIDVLLKNTVKNTYLVNGHNYLSNRLPIYLPGNGALLTAISMMAAGWDGAPDTQAPGFPRNGHWDVKWENLRPMP